MKLLVHMDETAYYGDSDGAVFSKPGAVSARFFRFLKPYFSQISVCIPALPVARTEHSHLLSSWNDLPVRLIPLPYWASMEDFWRHSPSILARLIPIAMKSVASHDVVWIRLPSASAPLFFAAAYAYRRPIILHVAGNIRTAWKLGQWGPAGKALRRTASEMMHWQTRGMAWRVPSLLTGSELCDLYGDKANGARFFNDSQVSGSDLVDERDTCNGTTIHVLFAGQLRRAKGIFELLEAVSSASAEKQVVARIVGSGPLAPDLERIAASPDGSHLSYAGFIPPGERLLGLYRESDIFVMPTTTYPEGFPRAILEAWASSLPVVATRVGGIPGLVIDGHNGLLVSPGSVDELRGAIQRIMNDGDLRRTLIRNGRESVRDFTGERQAQLAVTLLAESYRQLKDAWPQLKARVA